MNQQINQFSDEHHELLEEDAEHKEPRHEEMASEAMSTHASSVGRLQHRF
jgi:hypothetical protein